MYFKTAFGINFLMLKQKRGLEFRWEIYFNVILIAAIGALAISYVKDKFGAVTIIFLPITGGLVAALGLVTLPYTKSLTKLLASLIFEFTTLQPVLMCILITMAFSFLIVTPVSTVAMGLILFTK